MFKSWSETKKEALDQLKPDLGMRSWNDLSSDEKYKIWKFLEYFFFNLEKRVQHYSEDTSYKFSGENWETSIFKNRIITSILAINENFKHKVFWSRYLTDSNLDNACLDFHEIFHKQDENIVLELLSIYAKILLNWSKEKNRYLSKNTDETDEEYTTRFLDYQYHYFDHFSWRLNEVFEDFGLNVLLTRQWFIPRQWEKIVEEIYKPTLDFLSDNKYKEVNRELWDAFADYHRKDFSGCVTKTITAIQAFLQISIKWEIGEWDISELINESIKKWLISDDIFTKTIFDNIKSIIMRERKETADAHPKKEYANEQNARLILNIAMVFIQHFIQIQK